MRLRNVFIGACLVGLAPLAEANTATTFPSGSLIIPTTSAFQDDCGAVSVYGLVYDVLRANNWLSTHGYNQITIYYAYLDTKLSPNRCIPSSLNTGAAPGGPPATGTTANWNDGCDISGVKASLINNSSHAAATSSIVTYNNSGSSTTQNQCSGGTNSGNTCASVLTVAPDCPSAVTAGDCYTTCTPHGGATCNAMCVKTSGGGGCYPPSTCKHGTHNQTLACTIGAAGDAYCDDYSCAAVTTTIAPKANAYPNYSTVTVSGAATVSYGGGPFIILAQDAPTFRQLLDNTISAKDIDGNTIDFSPFRTRLGTQPAPPNSGCTLGTDHYVNIHATGASFVANVGKAFQNPPPRLALLSTYINGDTAKVYNGILEGYLQNAGLTYTGANGCPPGSVNAGTASICPAGATSGQIYDAFDFDDLVNNKLASVNASGKPLYSMLWTPHWETTTACTAAKCNKTSGGGGSCTLNGTSTGCVSSGGATCSFAGLSCTGINASETTAMGYIKTFLNGQNGLAAECASLATYEGDYQTGVAAEESALQLQTCLDNGAGKCSAGTTSFGIDRNRNPPGVGQGGGGGGGGGSTLVLSNCSDPGMTNGTECAYFSYPGDSFAQTGDYLWQAVTGHTATYLPNPATTSIYQPGVVPLIAAATLDTTKLGSPVPYGTCASGSSWASCLSTAALNARAMIDADLTTRNIKDNTPGESNILYLGGHDQTSSVAGTKVMMETLLQLGLTTLPPIQSTTEVSRNSPIVAQISGAPAVVQGTYEFVSPVPAGFPPTYSVNGDSSTFKFPAIHGHLRARTASSIAIAGSVFNASGIVFDAATGIPTPTPAGCGTWYTASCRTIFTTLATGVAPTVHYLTTAEVGAGSVGAAMATNTTGVVDLDTTNQGELIQKILAGDDSAITGIFLPALGGVDRSTVAVIGSSTLVNSTRATMAYFGADDGMIHAVCASTGTSGCDVLGRELWAYLPRTELGLVRYNSARIDGSPRVFDAFINNGTGERAWRTVLVFQTGTGDTTLQSRVPAVYALDVSDPTAPKVLWEYSLADVTHLGNYELGQGLTVAAGQVATGTLPKYDVYAQTNNAGTLGNGNVVTAINVDTGLKDWQNGYQFLTSLRAGGATLPSSTGMPGGAVGVDKTLSGYITDLVYGTLYGDLWLVDPATGLSRFAPGTLPAPGNPLLRFSTDKHAIGVSPAIYAVSSGGTQYAAFVTGGYTDSYPNDTNWTSAATTQYAMSVNLGTPAVDATINENKGTTGTLTSDIPIKFPLGAGENGYAEISIIDGQLFVTSDTADVNNSGTGGYGLAGATGHVYSAATGGNGLAQATVVVQGGASSVVASGTTVYSGASNEQMQLAAGATGTGAPVETTAATKMTRRLWLRTQ